MRMITMTLMPATSLLPSPPPITALLTPAQVHATPPLLLTKTLFKNDKLNNPNKFLIIVALQCLVMEKKDNMNLEMFIIISNITSLNLCDTKEPLTQSVPVILPSCGNLSYDIISTPSSKITLKPFIDKFHQ